MAIDEKPVKDEKKVVEDALEKIQEDIKERGMEFKRDVTSSSGLHKVNAVKLVEEVADIIMGIRSPGMKFFILTFNPDTRDLFRSLEKKGMDPEDEVYVLDALSQMKGLGTPPVMNLMSVSNGTDFDEIFVYTNLILEKMQSQNITCIMISPNEVVGLSHYSFTKTDYNDVGIFMNWYVDRLAERNIPVVFVVPENEDNILEQLIERLLDKKKKR